MSWFSITDPNKPPAHTHTSIMNQLAQAQQAQYGLAGLPPPNYGSALGQMNQYPSITAMSTAAGPQLYEYPNSYQIALPREPCEGDRVTIRYAGGYWAEERSINAEINPKKNNNSGVFSLDEIDEARELINELSR